MLLFKKITNLTAKLLQIIKITPIPPGLYVRMNLQTAKTEARLERNESKKGKAASNKTLSSHRKWS